MSGTCSPPVGRRGTRGRPGSPCPGRRSSLEEGMKGTRVLCCGPLSARKRKRRLCEFLRDRMTTGGQRYFVQVLLLLFLEVEDDITHALPIVPLKRIQFGWPPEFRRTLRYTLHSRSPANIFPHVYAREKRVLRRYNLKRGFFFFLCVSPPLLPHRVVDGRKKNLPHFPHVKFGERSEK